VNNADAEGGLGVSVPPGERCGAGDQSSGGRPSSIFDHIILPIIQVFVRRL